MTDRPDEPLEGAEPAEITEVRRLLAQARHDEPIPDEVAARLDGVLSGLARGDRTDAEPRAVVVPIASRRRGNLTGLLVAAAVVVAGVVVGPHLSLHSGGSTAATGSSYSSAAGGAEPSPNLGNTGNAQHLPSAQADGLRKLRFRDGRVVVRPGHFADDALVARAALKAPLAQATHQPHCAGVPTASRTVAAVYGHSSAALVYRSVKGTSQVVDLYLCGSSRPIKSATLPAPTP